MKTILLMAFSLFLMAFSVSSSANKVVITGEPMILEERGNIYYVPEAYTPTTTYHYVTVGGANKICYAEPQPDLASLQMQSITVEVGGKQVQWTCYSDDQTNFLVTH